MTENVKESLTAWITVTLAFGLFWLMLRLDIVPHWHQPVTDGIVAVQGLVLLTMWIRWLWRRRRLRRASGRAD